MTVSLNISRAEYLRVYSGSAKAVTAKTVDGRTVNFPANILRPYVSQEGIHGTYTIFFDDNNKYVDIKKIR